jgi:hypothetical protein
VLANRPAATDERKETQRAGGSNRAMG